MTVSQMGVAMVEGRATRGTSRRGDWVHLAWACNSGWRTSCGLDAVGKPEFLANKSSADKCDGPRPKLEGANGSVRTGPRGEPRLDVRSIVGDRHCIGVGSGRACEHAALVDANGCDTVRGQPFGQ